MKITVKDMTCNHCVATISKALLIQGIVAKVDLNDQSVNLSKEADFEKAKEVIKKAGYTV